MPDIFTALTLSEQTALDRLQEIITLSKTISTLESTIISQDQELDAQATRIADLLRTGQNSINGLLADVNALRLETKELAESLSNREQEVCKLKAKLWDLMDIK